MVHLVEIDGGNFREPLHVAESQREYVTTTFGMMAMAYAHRDEGGTALLVYADDIPVGMVMYYEYADADEYILGELLIDEKFQRKGYGEKATELVLDLMRCDGKYSKVCLCYIDGNHAARRLYEKFGFIETDRDEDEIIMELHL